MFNRHVQRRRPVGEVAAEVATIPERFFVFVDDNLPADPAYARELFAALAPLGKRWITQAALSFADDPALVAAAARAGCRGIFVGLETFSDGNLAEVNKGFNRVEEYRRKIRRLHAAGIAVEAGIVFGFDGDRTDVFRRTLRMLDDLALDVAQISISTPLPGTPRFERMQSRLTDRDWSHYDLHHVVFRPAGMSAAELQAGHDWVTREFYRPWRILRRLWRHAWRPGGLASLAGYHGRPRPTTAEPPRREGTSP